MRPLRTFEWMPTRFVRGAVWWLARIAVTAAIMVGLAALYWLVVSL